MKKLLAFTCAVAFAFSASFTFADVVDNSGAGFAITDNDPAGVSSDIVIGANEIITDVEVTIFGASHTWVGDIVATLSNGTTTVDLMSRTGAAGGTGFGDSSDLDGDYTFSNAGDDFWLAADAAGAADPVAAGSYFASTTDGTFVDLAAAFAGQNTAGTWTLNISDNAGGDTGSIGSWGLSISSAAVPEPSSFAILGLVGLAAAARRRR